MSVEELDSEGWYTDVLALRPGYQENFFSYQPGIQPVFNDMMDYYRAAGYSDKSPLYNAMAMGFDGGEPYARYWHGYAGILRLMLILFDCNEIKLISFMFQLLLVVLVSVAIRNRENYTFMFLFLTQYILLMPLAVSVSMVFAFSIDISLLGILLYIRFKDRMDMNGTKWIFFCIVGIFTCFLEELVFGVLTWGITCLWILLLYGKERKTGDNIRSVIKSGLAWIWGYGGIWVTKWIFASIVLGEDVLRMGFDTVMFRTSGNSLDEKDRTFAELFLERYEAVSENYKYYLYKVFFLILICWLIFLTFRIIRRQLNNDSRIPSLGLIALAPIVWYFVLTNHTLGHRFMTYRIYNFGIIAVLAILLITTEYDSAERTEKNGKYRGLLFRLAMVIVAGFLAIIPASNKTEKIESKNINVPGETVALSEYAGQTLRMELRPLAGRIDTLGVALYPSVIDGSYEFRLSHDGDILYTLEQPMSLFVENSWQTLDLGWKVDRKKEYTFEIIPKCGIADSGEVYAILSDDSPVSDFSVIEGSNIQMTYMIVYDSNMYGEKWLFYFLTWYAVFECLILVVKNIKIVIAGEKA